jgi:cytochrome c peroxidase
MSRTLIAATLVLAACGTEAAGPLVAPLGLEDAKLVDHADAPTIEKVELGKMLFFEPRLSGSGSMSCSTCHLPEQSWTDGKPFSKKDDGTDNTRNTPTVYNVGYYEKLYWDGRAAGLEANILAAWKAQMAGKPDDAARTLAGIAGYRDRFQTAYGQEPTAEGIVKALAAFLRMLRSGNSPFDRWRAGQQDAVGNDAKAGYELFMDKAGCNACHLPPLFTDRMFHVIGTGTDADKGAGGEKALNDPKLIGAFKTPSLRNVAKTAPYFHDASQGDLLAAVTFMVGGGKEVPNRDMALTKRELSPEQIRQLVAFLESLTGDVPFKAPELPK